MRLGLWQHSAKRRKSVAGESDNTTLHSRDGGAFAASSVAGSGSLFHGSVVAVAGAGDQLAAAMRRNYRDGHGAESAVTAAVSGIVSQNVLVADVVRDLLADVVHVIHIFREVSQAA